MIWSGVQCSLITRPSNKLSFCDLTRHLGSVFNPLVTGDGIDQLLISSGNQTQLSCFSEGYLNECRKGAIFPGNHRSGIVLLERM